MTSLEHEPSLPRLARGLSLCDGFEFDLLISPDPESLQPALEHLIAMLERLRGAPVTVVPYRDDGPDTDLIATILAPLLAARACDGPTLELHLVDATAAPFDDEARWAPLFGRMNEVRNHLRDELGAPLLIALPPHLETTFAQMAPDFWSIRSIAVRSRSGMLWKNA